MGIKSQNKKAKPPSRASKPWWETKDDPDGSKLAQRLFDTINTLEETQLSTITSNLKCFRVYMGREDLNTFTWFGAGQQAFATGAGLGTYDVPKINLLKAATQTLQSRIAADPVKVMALTDGGNHSDKMKGEMLNKFGAGVMDATGANQLLPEGFVDGMVFGDYYIHGFADNSEDGDWKICAEKVFPPEIIVDEAECLVTNGEPFQFYRKRVMSRSRLEALYSKKKAVIRMAQVETANLGAKAAVEDMIVIIEGWHRRSSWKSKDGRHVIAVSSGTLLDEPFTKNRFPFAHGRWTKLNLGFYGEGLVAQTASIQSAVTKELYIIDQALEICGMPFQLVEDGSDVTFEHLSTGIGGITKYTGTKPELMAPPPVAQEHFQYLELLMAKFNDVCRLSEFSATGAPPPNLKSGPAIRTQQAVESIGWKQTLKDYQQVYIDTMEMLVDVARDISEKDPGFSVKTKDDKFLRKQKWTDIDLPNSKYTWRLWPTSLLPDSPEGKFDKVQELVQGGFVTPEQGLYMLDIPDTKSITQYNEAAIRWTEWAIGKILDEGVKVAVLPFANLGKVIETAQAAYLIAQMEEVSQAKLAMLQTFWQQAIDLQSKAMAPAAGPASGAAALAPQPGATPQAVPMHAPPTPLLPQVGAHA